MSKYVLAEILGTNESTMLQAVKTTEEKYGLTLTAEDVHQLVLAKKDILVAEERIELDEGSLPDLLERCAASSFVMQDNVVEIVGEMQAAFYRFRNEWDTLLTDDSLKTIMMIGFEKVCGGDMELLESTFMSGLKLYLSKNPMLWHIGANYILKTGCESSYDESMDNREWTWRTPEPVLSNYIPLDLSELDIEARVELSEAIFGDIVSVSDEDIRRVFYSTVLDDEITLDEDRLMEFLHTGFPAVQLMPILQRVAKKYKGTDSSSIKNSEAKRLLAGIDYSIQRGMQKEGLLGLKHSSAELFYEIGQEAIYAEYKNAIERLKKLQKEIIHFNNQSMIDDFKEVGRFLYRYDYRYMPQLGELILNYPILVSYENKTGIEKVEAFLNCIECEQSYFRALSRAYLAMFIVENKNELQGIYVNCFEVILRADYEKANAEKIYFSEGRCRSIEQNGDIVDVEVLEKDLLEFVEKYQFEENSTVSIFMNYAVSRFAKQWTS